MEEEEELVKWEKMRRKKGGRLKNAAGSHRAHRPWWMLHPLNSPSSTATTTTCTHTNERREEKREKKEHLARGPLDLSPLKTYIYMMLHVQPKERK